MAYFQKTLVPRGKGFYEICDKCPQRHRCKNALKPIACNMVAIKRCGAK